MSTPVHLHFLMDSPLGSLVAGATDEGLCLLEFRERDEIPKLQQELGHLFRREMVEEDHPMLEVVRLQLAEYFGGNRTVFDFPVHMVGTDFQKAVWSALTSIPYGTTRSYKEQALTLGNLEAIRAVAAANGANRVAIVVPCHRVVGSDGSLVGYAGGIWRKQWLLAHERRQLTLF